MKTVFRLGILFAALAGGIYAQSVAGLGAISGTVRDASGSVVPDAKVAVNNDARGIHRSLTSSGGGIFTAPSLTPSSDYSITVSKAGFAPYEAKQVEVLVGQNVRLD